jgi:hypothetical protein
MASSLHSRPVQGRERSSDRGTLGFSIMCVHDLVALQAHAVPDAVAIIPLDPTSPTTRLAMLLEDSAVPPVVTQPDIVEQMPAGKWRTIVLDENIPFRMKRPASTHTCLSAERLRTRTIGL